MPQVLDRLVKRCFRGIGLEVQRLKGANTEEAAMRHMLTTLQAATVLDIGANQGQFAQTARSLGYKGRIVSFEAVPAIHAILTARARGDQDWVVAPCAALGAAEGEVEINVSANTWSSSVLPMGEVHLSAAPESKYVATQRVRMARLDGLSQGLVPEEGRMILKIDTQGYEREVLAGATGLLDRIVGMQVELSLVTLYQGAPRLSEMVSFLESLDFELFNLAPGFKDRRNGRLLQAEGFFVRKGVSL